MLFALFLKDNAMHATYQCTIHLQGGERYCQQVSVGIGLVEKRLFSAVFEGFEHLIDSIVALLFLVAILIYLAALFAYKDGDIWPLVSEILAGRASIVDIM